MWTIALILTFTCSTNLVIAETQLPAKTNDTEKTKVVVIRGSQIAEMVNRGMSEIGGLQRFIEKGKWIAIKPDMSTDALPEEGLTTNPQLVKYIAKQCYKIGLGGATAFDYCTGTWTRCYKNSGIERAAKDAGVKMLPGNHVMYFQEQEIIGARVLTHAQIHTSVNTNDKLFDIPVLKRDEKTTISGGVKNLMGCVFEPDFYLKNGLDSCLAEFLFYKNPELTIIDAGHLLGTTSGENMEQVLIISTNVVAADAVACRMLGIDPQSVNHLRIASELGLGTISDDKINVINIVVSREKTAD